MTEPQTQLRAVPDEFDEDTCFVVDPRTGEQTGTLGDYLQPLRDNIAGLHRAVKAENLRYENLKRDKAKEAREHSLFPKAKEVFEYWCEVCHHPNSRMSPERFYLMQPLLERYGVDLCKRACDGAAYDPFTTKRKNGSVKRHDGLHLIFDPDKFEDFVNRAPLEKLVLPNENPADTLLA